MNTRILKTAIFSFALLVISAFNSFAVNAVDSDLSNSAGSNRGKDHLGMYVAICLFLVLAAVIPFVEKRKHAE